MSWISLCLINRNPPWEQLIACSTVSCLPQTQWEGKCGGHQPYHRQRASLRAPLWRVNPCFMMGRVESQVDAPFSLEAV